MIKHTRGEGRCYDGPILNSPTDGISPYRDNNRGNMLLQRKQQWDALPGSHPIPLSGTCNFPCPLLGTFTTTPPHPTPTPSELKWGYVPLSGHLTSRKCFPELGKEAFTHLGSPKGKAGRTSEPNQPFFAYMRLRFPPNTGPRSQSNHVPRGSHEFSLLAHWTA